MAAIVISRAKYGALYMVHWGANQRKSTVQTYTTHIGLKSDRLTCIGTLAVAPFSHTRLHPSSPIPQALLFSCCKNAQQTHFDKIATNSGGTGISKPTSNIIRNSIKIIKNISTIINLGTKIRVVI